MNESLKAAAVLLVFSLQVDFALRRAAKSRPGGEGQRNLRRRRPLPPRPPRRPCRPRPPSPFPAINWRLLPTTLSGNPTFRISRCLTNRSLFLQPVLTNSPRIDQLIQSGKLMLSLEDAISLALENNMDIAVQRFTPCSTKPLCSARASGVNGRLVFDPVLTGQGYIAKVSDADQQSFPGRRNLSTTGLPVAPDLICAQCRGQLQLHAGFHPGTQLQVTFNNNRSSINFPANLFNPFVESTLTVQVTQPLLNGFGKVPTLAYILEASNTVKVGESQFAQQVINTVAQVSTIIGSSSSRAKT